MSRTNLCNFVEYVNMEKSAAPKIDFSKIIPFIKALPQTHPLAARVGGGMGAIGAVGGTVAGINALTSDEAPAQEPAQKTKPSEKSLSDTIKDNLPSGEDLLPIGLGAAGGAGVSALYGNGGTGLATDTAIGAAGGYGTQLLANYLAKKLDIKDYKDLIDYVAPTVGGAGASALRNSLMNKGAAAKAESATDWTLKGAVESAKQPVVNEGSSLARLKAVLHNTGSSTQNAPRNVDPNHATTAIKQASALNTLLTAFHK